MKVKTVVLKKGRVKGKISSPPVQKKKQKRQSMFQAGRFLELQMRSFRHLAKVIDHLSVFSSNHLEKGVYEGVRDMTAQLPPVYGYHMHVSSKHVYGMTNRKRRNPTRLNRHYCLTPRLIHPIQKEKGEYYPDYDEDLMASLELVQELRARQRIALSR